MYTLYKIKISRHKDEEINVYEYGETEQDAIIDTLAKFGTQVSIKEVKKAELLDAVKAPN